MATRFFERIRHHLHSLSETDRIPIVAIECAEHRVEYTPPAAEKDLARSPDPDRGDIASGEGLIGRSLTGEDLARFRTHFRIRVATLLARRRVARGLEGDPLTGAPGATAEDIVNALEDDDVR